MAAVRVLVFLEASFVVSEALDGGLLSEQSLDTSFDWNILAENGINCSNIILKYQDWPKCSEVTDTAICHSFISLYDTHCACQVSNHGSFSCKSCGPKDKSKQNIVDSVIANQNEIFNCWEFFLEHDFRRSVSTGKVSPSWKASLIKQSVGNMLFDFQKAEKLSSITEVQEGIDGSRQKNPLNENSTLTYINAAIAEGKSFIFKYEALNDANSMSNLIESLENSLSTNLTAHIYVSARNIRALDWHTDPYDVFVVQIQGIKVWTLCVPKAEDFPPEMTLADRAILFEITRMKSTGCSTLTRAQVDGMSCQTHTLEPGDFLYVPQSVVHSAASDSDVSVHVTFGMQVRGRTWLSFVKAALQCSYGAMNASSGDYQLLDSVFAGISSTRTLKYIRPHKFMDVDIPVNLTWHWHLPFPIWMCRVRWRDSSWDSCRDLVIATFQILIDQWKDTLVTVLRVLEGQDIMDKVGVKKVAETANGAETKQCLETALAQISSNIDVGEPCSRSKTLNVDGGSSSLRIAQGSVVNGWTSDCRYTGNCGCDNCHCDSCFIFCWSCECDSEDNCGCDSNFDCFSWGCSVGFYKANNYCAACSPGWYCPSGDSAVSCPVGMYSNAPQSTFCIFCAQGSYGPSVALSACFGCPLGTYQDQTGTTSCILCPAGKYSASLWMTTCVVCPQGTFQNQIGAWSCLLCPTGKYMHLTGNTACYNCGTGKYQEILGAISEMQCNLCREGTYQTGTGIPAQSECINCFLGTFSVLTGRTSCLSCFAGTYSRNVGTTACFSCPTGKYQSMAGASICISCQPGTYQIRAEQTYCVDCLGVLIQPDQNGIVCQKCTAEGNLFIMSDFCFSQKTCYRDWTGKFSQPFRLSPPTLTVRLFPEESWQGSSHYLFDGEMGLDKNLLFFGCGSNSLTCALRAQKVVELDFAMPSWLSEIQAFSSDANVCSSLCTITLSFMQISGIFINRSFDSCLIHHPEGCFNRARFEDTGFPFLQVKKLSFFLHSEFAGMSPFFSELRVVSMNRTDKDSAVEVSDTFKQFGCQVCLSNTTKDSLTNNFDLVPCPELKCFDDTNNIFHTSCVNGFCNQRAAKCKICHECSDPQIGCTVVENHCELSDGTCGCKIDNECYEYTTPTKTVRRKNNPCQISSARFSSDLSRCTGFWVNEDDGNTGYSPSNCAGALACSHNQACSSGQCTSIPYSTADYRFPAVQYLPCCLNLSCTGNKAMYVCTEGITTQDQIVCRQKDVLDWSDLPEYCETDDFLCPAKDNWMTSRIEPGFGESSLISNSLGNVRQSQFVSNPFFFVNRLNISVKQTCSVICTQDQPLNSVISVFAVIRSGSIDVEGLKYQSWDDGLAALSNNSIIAHSSGELRAHLFGSVYAGNQGKNKTVTIWDTASGPEIPLINGSLAMVSFDNACSSASNKFPEGAIVFLKLNILCNIEEQIKRIERMQPSVVVACVQPKHLEIGLSDIRRFGSQMRLSMFKNRNMSDHFRYNEFAESFHPDMHLNSKFMEQKNQNVIHMKRASNLLDYRFCSDNSKKNGIGKQNSQGCPSFSVLKKNQVSLGFEVPVGMAILETDDLSELWDDSKSRLDQAVIFREHVNFLRVSLDGTAESFDGLQIQGVVLSKPKETGKYQKSWPLQEYGMVFVSQISTVDLSPPPVGLLKIASHPEEGIASIFFLNSNGDVSVSWEAFRWIDPLSGMCRFSILVIESNQSLSEVALSEEEFYAGSSIIGFPERKDGTLIRVSAEVMNCAGLTSSWSSAEYTIDCSPPKQDEGAILDCFPGKDSQIKDVNFSSSSISMYACWKSDKFIDLESGIKLYYFRVEMRKYYPDSNERWYSALIDGGLHPQKLATQSFETTSSYLTMQFPRNIVNLKHGFQYRTGVLAINNAELPPRSQLDSDFLWSYSNGIVVDNTSPHTGSVRHMCRQNFDESVEPCIAQNDTSILSIVCSAFYDWESEFLYLRLKVQPMNSEENVSNGYAERTTEAVQQNSFMMFRFNNLSLQHGIKYVVILNITNDAGLLGSVVSDGIMIDTTCPNTSSAFVYDADLNYFMDVYNENLNDIDYTSENHNFLVYFGGFADEEGLCLAPTSRQSGISFYEVGLGNKPTVDNIIKFQKYIPEPGRAAFLYVLSSRNHFSQTMEQSLEDGKRVFAIVRACNAAGLCSSMASDGVTVDSSTPSIDVFNDGTVLGYDKDFQKENDMICACWNNSDSSIKNFFVAYARCKTLSRSRSFESFDDLNWVLVETNTSIYCFKDEFERGELYCFLLVAENLAGVFGNVSITDGVMISRQILAGVVRDGESGEDLDFQTTTNRIACSWSDFVSPDVQLVEINVSILSTSGVEAFKRGIAATESSVVIQNLSLGNGLVYTCEVCAVNLLDQDACVKSNGVLLDNTPPIPGRIVNGLLLNEHIKLQQSSSPLSMSWDKFSDNETGVDLCFLALGSRPGDNDIFYQNVGRNISVTLKGLAFQHGQQFYITITCKNFAGLLGWNSSSGIFVHNVVPMLTLMNFEGLSAETSFVQTPKSFEIVWESQKSFLEIKVWALIEFRSSSEHIWCNNAPIGIFLAFEEEHTARKSTYCTCIAVSDNIFLLKHNSSGNYSLSLTLIDELLRTTHYQKFPLVIFDSSPPLKGIVECTKYISGNDNLRVNCQDFEDYESGVTSYDICIGISLNDETIKPCQRIFGKCTYEFFGPFPHGQLYASVRAWNGVGLETSSSAIFWVDTTSPSPVSSIVIHPGSIHPMAALQSGGVRCLHSSSDMFVTWTSSEDDESGVVDYAVALQAEGSQDVSKLHFEHVGLKESVRIDTELEVWRQYRVVVQAWNRVGMISTAYSSYFKIVSIIFQTPQFSEWFFNAIAFTRTDVIFSAKFLWSVDPSVTFSEVELGLGTFADTPNLMPYANIYSSSPLWNAGDSVDLDISGCEPCGGDCTSSVTRKRFYMSRNFSSRLFENAVHLHTTFAELICDPVNSAIRTLDIRAALLTERLQADFFSSIYVFIRLKHCDGIDSRYVQPVNAVFKNNLTVQVLTDGKTPVEIVSYVHAVYVTWTQNTFSSGIVRAYVGIGLSEKDVSVRAFQLANDSTFRVIPSLPQGVLFANVRVFNGAGYTLTGSVQFRVDDTSPSPVSSIVIHPGSIHPMEALQSGGVRCLHSSSDMFATWTSSEDDESGVVDYAMAVQIEGNQPASGLNFTHVGLTRSVRIDAKLETWQQYRVVIQAWNRVGMFSTSQSEIFVAGSLPWSIDIVDVLFAFQFNSTFGSFHFSINSSNIKPGVVQIVSYSVSRFLFGDEIQQIANVVCNDVQNDDFKSISCQSDLTDFAMLQHHHKLFVTVRVKTCFERHVIGSREFLPHQMFQRNNLGIIFVNDRGSRVVNFSSVDFWMKITNFNPIKNQITEIEVKKSGENEIQKFSILTGQEIFFFSAKQTEIFSVTARQRYGSLVVGTTSATIIVDITPPQIQNITLGYGLDSDGCLAAGPVSAFWENFVDTESGVAGYEYCIVQARSARANMSLCSFVDVGMNTFFAVQSPFLIANEHYAVAVRARNMAGLYSHISWSKVFVVVDTEPFIQSESLVLLEDRHLWLRMSVAAQATTSVECVLEPVGEKQSLLLEFDIKNSSNPRGGVLNQSVSCRFSTRGLIPGQFYFAGVTATTCKFTTKATSNSIIFDPTPPNIEGLYGICGISSSMFKDLLLCSADSAIQLHWNEIANPENRVQSLLLALEYQLNNTNQSPPGSEWRPLRNLDVASRNATIELSELMGLPPTFHVLLTVRNAADLAQAASLLVQLDLTPPVLAFVHDGLGPSDASCQRSGAWAAARWGGAGDSETGVSGFTVSVGTCCGCADLVQITGLEPFESWFEARLPEPVPAGKNIFVTVTVINGVGARSMKCSDGVRVLCDEAAQTCPCQTDTVCI